MVMIGEEKDDDLPQPSTVHDVTKHIIDCNQIENILRSFVIMLKIN